MQTTHHIFSFHTSGWRKAHPAGAHWIDWYDGRDATEVMDGFHTAKGRAMYERLPKSKETTAKQLEETVAPDSSTQKAFRQLRTQLENDGWWERDMVHEFKLLGIWASLVVGAAATAHSIPFVSAILLGLSMTNAGWLGHDFIHGVDKYSENMRIFCPLASGLGPTWWSDKHNKHHALSKFVTLMLLFTVLKNYFQTIVRSLVCAFVLFLSDELLNFLLTIMMMQSHEFAAFH